MIIYADVDRAESDKYPHMEGTPTKVLVYASDTYDLAAGLEAIERVRLIREGHVFRIDIHPAWSRIGLRYDLVVDEDGEVVEIRDRLATEVRWFDSRADLVTFLNSGDERLQWWGNDSEFKTWRDKFVKESTR